MKNYAVIENNKVVNLCVASSEDAKPDNWVLCEIGGIGWDYINGQLVDNRPKPAEPKPAPAPTKEQLMAELATLTAKIQALE